MPLTGIIVLIVLAIFLVVFAFPRLDARIFIALALLLLAVSGMMLMLEKPILADQIAGYAFYSLTSGIILLLIQRFTVFTIPRLDARIFIALALLLLALSGMMLMLEKPILADQIAGYAFYTLTSGIVLLIIQRFRESCG